MVDECRRVLASWGSSGHTVEMVELNEPQVWTLIGVFAASMFAMMGVVSSSFTRVLRAEVGGLRDTMDARFEQVNTRFEQVNTRLDHLDRDVQALTRRVFDRPE